MQHLTLQDEFQARYQKLLQAGQNQKALTDTDKILSVANAFYGRAVLEYNWQLPQTVYQEGVVLIQQMDQALARLAAAQLPDPDTVNRACSLVALRHGVGAVPPRRRLLHFPLDTVLPKAQHDRFLRWIGQSLLVIDQGPATAKMPFIRDFAPYDKDPRYLCFEVDPACTVSDSKLSDVLETTFRKAVLSWMSQHQELMDHLQHSLG